MSSFFRDPQIRGGLVKSPVELMIGTFRTFEISIDRTQYECMVCFSEDLGQNLFHPPNVNGWPRGADWINTYTALERRRFLQWLYWGRGHTLQENDESSDTDAAKTEPRLNYVDCNKQCGILKKQEREAAGMRGELPGILPSRIDLNGWFENLGSTKKERLIRASRVLLPSESINPSYGMEDPSMLIYALISDTSYQLK